MNTRDAEAILWSWGFLARTLATLRAVFGWQGALPDWVTRAAWRKANGELRGLEATARRLIIAMAVRLRSAQPRQRSAPDRTAPPRGASGFVLFETIAMPAMLRRHAAGRDAGPRIRDPGAPAAPLAPLPLETPLVSAGNLSRRIAALEGVIARPRNAARRMQRFLARPRPRRICPIRTAAPPGPRPNLQTLAGSTLDNAHRLAIAALNAQSP